MFRTWFVSEASWRHNRLHLVVAAVALLLLVANPQLPSAILATVVVGSLLIRMYLWNRRSRRAALSG